MRVQRLDTNRLGNDYAVGDIHGCFDQLTAALAAVSFDPERDRLLSVGDLVDRGPKSQDAVDWLRLPWFYAVRGNHEQMAIGVANGKHDIANYMMNGGTWFISRTDTERAECRDMFDALPVCIEVPTPNGTFGLVHAEPAGNDWQAFCERLEKPASNNKFRDDLETALWCRDRYRYKITDIVEGIDRVYVGHTPVDEPLQLGNVFYIDTGIVFGRSLTLVNLTTDKVHNFPERGR